jgi:outer membrane lipoprotein-sorting protein
MMTTPRSQPLGLTRVMGLCVALLISASPGFAQQTAPKAGVPAPSPAPASANTSKAPAKVEPAPTVEKVNAYFNSLKGLQADFLQIAPDGRSFTGTLYILRPGRMRFEYNPPATLEIVADGRSVSIRDRKLNTQDVYFIGQTPLKFLLQPKIDVAKDSKVTGLKRDGAHIQLSLEDKSTLGGTSQIRVMFDGTNYALKEWTVIDPQGMETRVALSNVDTGVAPKASLFVINEQKLITPNN